LGKASTCLQIKFNRRIPARKEPSNIVEDVKKIADYRKGYILWLNWDREISDEHLNKVAKLIENYLHVKRARHNDLVFITHIFIVNMR
jgi:hypothetical protein